MSNKPIRIQENFKVENCIKCGRKPVIMQDGKVWIVLCPNIKCDNKVEGRIVDFNSWDNQNKK
jgi:hypothetical protein